MKVIGVDLGIRKFAWSVWEDGVLVRTGAYSQPDHLPRNKQLRGLARDMATRVMSKEKPDYVFIEDTLIGNNRKYSINLSQTMGAILTVMTADTFLVNVSTWKKEVIGTGNATKELVRDYITQTNSAYAVLCDGDQDQFDAACIGYYGVLVARRAEQLEVARSAPDGD